MSSTDPKFIDPDTGLEEGQKISNPNLKQNSKPSFIDDTNIIGSNQNSYTPVYGSFIDESDYNQNVARGSVDAGELDQVRAANQPWYDQAGNFLARAAVGEVVLGSIEGAGYIGSLLANIGKSPVEALKNSESDVFMGIANWAAENKESLGDQFKIYQQAPGTFNPGDSGWWFENGISVASTLSMLIPSRGAVSILSKLARMSKINRLTKIGGNTAWLLESITGATVSRHIENMMEARGTFQEQYEKYKNLRAEDGTFQYTDEQARQMAGDAASFTYNANWAMLAQDVFEHMFLFKTRNPFTGVAAKNPLHSALTKSIANMGPIGKKIATSPSTTKALGLFGTAMSEGGEEAYQFITAEESKYRADLQAGLIDETTFRQRMGDYMEDDEMWNSAFFGALGGAVFQALGENVSDITERVINPEGYRLRKESETRQATWMNQRNAELSNLNAKIKDAYDKGDEALATELKNRLNFGSALDALEMGQLDSYMDYLYNLKEVSNSEDNLSGEDKLDKEFIKQNIDNMIEDAKTVERLYKKYVKNNDANVLKALIHNDFYRGKALENLKKHNLAKDEIINSFPGVEHLKPQDRTLIDLNLKRDAYNIESKLFSEIGKSTADDLLLEKAAAAKKRVEKLNEQIKTLKDTNKELEDLDLDDNSDLSNNIRKSIEQSDELIRAYNGIAQNEDYIDIYNRRIDLLKNKEYQESNLAKQLAMRINNMTTVSEIDSEINDITNNDSITPEQKENLIKLLKQKRDQVVKSLRPEEVQQKKDSVNANKVNNSSTELDEVPPEELATELTEDMFKDFLEEESNPEPIKPSGNNFNEGEEDSGTELTEDDIPSLFEEDKENAPDEIDDVKVDLKEDGPIVSLSDNDVPENISEDDSFNPLLSTDYKTNGNGLELQLPNNAQEADSYNKRAFFDFSRMNFDKRGMKVRFSTPIGTTFEQEQDHLVKLHNKALNMLLNERGSGASLEALADKYIKLLDNFPIVARVMSKDNPDEVLTLNGLPVETNIYVNRETTFPDLQESRRHIALNAILKQFNNEDIDTSTIIEGQFPLMVNQTLGAENNIEESFQNETYDIFFVNRRGRLKKHGKANIEPLVTTFPASQHGKFYALVQGVRKDPVPIKLNNKLHDANSAKLIADIYRDLFETRNKPASDITNTNILNNLKELFPEFDSLGIPKTYRDVLNFFVNSDSKSNAGTTKQLYLEKGKLYYDVGKQPITRATFNDHYNSLVEYLQKKNWNINAKLLDTNEKYRNFVLGNKILNTDAHKDGEGNLFYNAGRFGDNNFSGRIFVKKHLLVDIVPSASNVKPSEAKKINPKVKPIKKTKPEQEVAKVSKNNNDAVQSSNPIEIAQSMLKNEGKIGNKTVIPKESLDRGAKDIMQNLKKKKC